MEKDNVEAMTEAVEEIIKKESAKKTPVKRASTKKASTKKTESTKESARGKMKTSLYLQFNGIEVEEQDIFAKVKEVWVSGLGKKIKDIRTLSAYVKPEEQAVYYVINESETGRVEL